MSDLINPWSIREITLKPGEDEPSRRGCWCFLRISSGWAYWLGMASPLRIELGAGDVIMTNPQASGTLRASQPGTLAGHCLSVDPFLLQSYLGADEMRYVTRIAPKTKPSAVLYHPSHAVSRQYENIASAPDDWPAMDRGRRVLMMLMTALQPGWPARRLAITVQLDASGCRKLNSRDLTDKTLSGSFNAERICREII